MTKPTLALTALCAALLSACSESSNYDFDSSREEAVAQAQSPGSADFAPRYDPANGILPFPDNLLFTGSSDGTLNIPVDDAEDFSDPLVALNALDGFASSAPISVALTGPANPASVVLGDSVRVFELSTSDDGVAGISRELSNAEIYPSVAGDNDDTIVILPIVPLSPATTYLVVLTKGITSSTDDALDKSVSYYLTSSDIPLEGDLAELEPVRQLTARYEAAAATAGVNEDDIALSWAFTTQSMQPTMDALSDSSQTRTLTLAEGAVNTSALGSGFDGSANIYAGTIELPYYQNSPADSAPPEIINGFWRTASGGFTTSADPAPAQRSIQTVPLLVSVPASDTPSGGWPVAIFQHGITRNRSDMLTLADNMAKAGIALLAIDLPMHGITDDSSVLHADSPVMSALGATERHFDLDLQNNSSMQAGSDSMTDSSGAHFYNLSNLLNARDNLRQAVADLLNLKASLGGLSDIGIDGSSVSFIGHSLGAIAGTVFLAQDAETGPAVLSVPGVGLARLLAESASFGPVIESALSDAGIPLDSAEYEQFLTAAQTDLDSADPVNYAADAAALHPVLLHEVVGNSAGSLSDQVIPNAVLTAPLSGTEPQIRLMALDAITSTEDGAGGAVSGAVRFVAGDHGSLLSPEADLATTIEMQTQVADYLASGGTRISVNNPDVVAGN